ncbi:MAG: hypothetical protein ACREF7_00925, partial [Candidatus Saccharimonadales bacterium]
SLVPTHQLRSVLSDWKTWTPMPKAAPSSKLAKKKQPQKQPMPKTVAYRRLPNVWELSKNALYALWAQRWTIILILVVYGLVNLVVAQGFSSGLSVSSAKTQLSSLFHGHLANLGGSLSIYALMLGSLGSSNSGGSFGYSIIFAVIASLAIIWVIRNSSNNAKSGIRDSFYKGMYPLIPFLAILLLIGVELLPMIAGISIYVTAINNLVAITALEKLLFVAVMVILAVPTIYWLSSSIIALYIVTLPDMTPIKALRSAKDLVRKRRMLILPRLLFLPLALLVISALIMLPFISWVAAAAPWIFLLLSLIMLAITNSYLYNLYRELLL